MGWEAAFALHPDWFPSSSDATEELQALPPGPNSNLVLET